jgi:hypothetical protein
MNFHPWALLIALPPVLALVFLNWKMKLERAQKRDPFTEPLLRPPGESCRQKVNELSDDLSSHLFWFVAPVIFAICMFYAPLSFTGSIILFLLSAVFTFFTSKRFWKTATDIRNYQLGFDGERNVGQELNEALSFGCKVYHDVQFDGYNIDHVIVAPSGVYAIETKTRRKGLEKIAHRVRYDGQKLIFPEWEDAHGLEQALNNAKSLSVWLSGAVGERVWIEPILTLPGWLVDRQVKGNVNVLNPKEIVGFVTRQTQAVLSQQLIERISHQLKQKNVIT